MTGSTAGTAAPDPTALTAEDVPDEIVRSITIAAPAERVFTLVSEPGWFINDGSCREHELTDLGGGRTRVLDPVHGAFVIESVTLEAPHRAVFRWLDGDGESGGDAGAAGSASTTVEFTIAPHGDGVELTVRESGFASLPGDAAARRRRFEENTDGWIEELGVARTVCEAAQ